MYVVQLLLQSSSLNNGWEGVCTAYVCRAFNVQVLALFFQMFHFATVIIPGEGDCCFNWFVWSFKHFKLEFVSIGNESFCVCELGRALEIFPLQLPVISITLFFG